MLDIDNIIESIVVPFGVAIYKTKKIESKWDNNNENCVGGCNGCRVF